MGALKIRKFLICYFTVFLLPAALLADPKKEKDYQLTLPAVLKANSIDGDRKTNVINAVGNVELSKDGNIIFADKMSYNKNDNFVRAYGNVMVKNYQLGNIFAQYAEVKDDISVGHFDDATIVFVDGSYIKAPKIVRENTSQTTFKKSMFSVCPNPDISENNELAGKSADLITLKSKETTIDKEKGEVKTKDAILKVYDVPIFYTPYLKTPLPAKKRKSGFLHPSYMKSDKLGLGFRVPYYFDIAPNKDLTSTLQLHPGDNNLILENDYRHLLKQGLYTANLELANNKVKKTDNVVTVSAFDKSYNKSARWYLKSNGDLAFSKNLGMDFSIDNLGDKDYLRDYHNSFLGYTVSKINLDYIKERNYHSIKTVKVQDLEIYHNSNEEPLALPIINSYIESKPDNGFLNERYSLLSNFTAISRESGVQYRRASLKPEVRLPYNIYGNLFEVGTNIQGDFYNIENNFTDSARNNNYDRTELNYRPETYLSWNLPLIKKSSKQTIILEPMVKFVTSSYKNRYSAIPNEDSNDTELTHSNLFLNDRFTGFDRNESGQRISYGAKSSLFNSLGQFGLGLGQSKRKDDKVQDVVIRGFNDSNRSNIVGEVSYKSPKVFSITYNFQLNESNYRNDINEVTSNLSFEKFSLGVNYLFLRKTINNPNEKEQIDLTAALKITSRLTLDSIISQDLSSKRTISKKYGLLYDGCCVSYGFQVTESNPSSLTKAQKSYNLNFSIKNL